MSKILWEDISKYIFRDYPDLKTDVLQVGKCSCRYFILPSGFKDIGNALVFGFVEGDSKDEMFQLLQKLESVAKISSLNKIVGPLDFSTFFNYRLPIDHMERSAYPGEPTKNIFLLEALEKNSFQILKKYYSHEMSVHWNIRFFIFIKVLGAFGSILSRRKWNFISLSQFNYKNHLQELFEVTHEIFSSNFLYQKIPLEVFELFFEKSILPHIDESASILALSPQGKLLGYSLSLKDPTHPRRLLFKSIGVKRSEAKGLLLGRQLMRAVYLAAQKSKETCFACLMIEGNAPDRLLQKHKLSFFTQSYALFSKNLE